MGQVPIHVVPTHRRPHPDELLGYMLLKKYGEKKFPGVSKAPLMFWDSIGNGPDGKPTDGNAVQAFGYLPLGIGGGPFDEHPANGVKRKKGECVTTLIAKELEIDDPAWAPIIEYIRVNDLEGKGNERFSIPSVMKSMYEDRPEKEVVDWAKLAFEAWYYEEQKCRVFAVTFDELAEALGHDQDPALAPVLEYVEKVEDKSNVFSCFDIEAGFRLISRMSGIEIATEWLEKALITCRNQQRRFLNAVEEFREKAVLTEYKEGVFVADIKSDSTAMSAAFRSKNVNVRVGVLVQHKSTGHVQIFTHKGLVPAFEFKEIVKVIRMFEQDEKRKMVTTDWDLLVEEGRVKGAEEWWVDTEQQNMYNGSLTTPGVPPTNIPFEEIVRGVGVALDKKLFPASRKEKCLKGVCTSTTANPCSWYVLGTNKCRQIRLKSREGEKVQVAPLEKKRSAPENVSVVPSQRGNEDLTLC